MIYLVLIFGLLLRLVNLNQSFWLDEATQAQLSSQSISQIWFGRIGDFHPPLFYLMSHFWLAFGHSEIWLRLLPVIFGMATIWLVYRFGNVLSPRLGLVASLLLAINQFHIYYSQEFRMYSLLAFLGTLSMYAFYRKHWSLFLINALLLYTHYSSFFLIITQLFYVFIFNKKLIRFTVTHLVLSIILYLPWVPQFLGQLRSGVNIDTYLPGWRSLLTVSYFKSIPFIFFKFVAGRINLQPNWVYALYIAFVLTGTTMALLATFLKRKFLFTWMVFPILASIVVSFVIPQTQPFRLIYVLPALILLLAQACVRFPRLFVTIVVYISIIGNFMYLTRPRLQREQWRQAIEFLSSHPAPVIVAFSDKFSSFYWYAPKFPVIPAVSSFPAQSEQVSQTLSASLLPAKVYSLEYLSALTDPNGLIGQILVNLGFKQTNVYNFDGVGLIMEYSKL